MVTPADINRKQFAVTRIKGGYDQEEVDDFLDLVEADYNTVINERDEYKSEIEILRRKLENATSPDSAVTQVIPVTPSASAEKLLAAAQRTVEAVEADANAEAGRIRATARAEADGLKNSAEAERQKILNQLETERAELEERIEALRAKRSTYKSWLKNTLSRLEEEEAGDA